MGSGVCPASASHTTPSSSSEREAAKRKARRRARARHTVVAKACRAARALPWSRLAASSASPRTSRARVASYFPKRAVKTQLWRARMKTQLWRARMKTQLWRARTQAVKVNTVVRVASCAPQRLEIVRDAYCVWYLKWLKRMYSRNTKTQGKLKFFYSKASRTQAVNAVVLRY